MPYSVKVSDLCAKLGATGCNGVLTLDFYDGKDPSAGSFKQDVTTVGAPGCSIMGSTNGVTLFLNGTPNGCADTHYVMSNFPSFLYKLTYDGSNNYKTITAYHAVGGTEELSSSQPLMLTGQNLTYFFSWGFGVVMFFFLLGYCVGVVLKLIRKV